MNKSYIFLIIIVLILAGVYFAKRVESPTVDNTKVDSAVKAEDQNKDKEEVINKVDNTKKVMQATLKTTKGEIVIEFGTTTPKTVENFTKLAQAGFYNGTKFHRVIKGFMIQGGDPLTKDDSKMAFWGTGDPGYKFNDEFTATNKNDVGTISMANSGPNTNGSQFFINVNNNNFLDPKHTVFGKVVKGMEVVTAIENTPTAPGDRPLTPMVIESITIK